MIRVVESPAELRAAVAELRSAGTVGLVPTMGALHAGHAHLIDVAVRESDSVVVSVFVNPLQFGPSEDYGRYPRTFEADCALAESRGARLVFAPRAEVLTPPDGRTFVEVAGLDATLCGPRRPGHFRGVATIVLKLLNLVRPDVAVFGAKDAQQVRVIAAMVRDLNVPVQLIVAETVREPDGLALSSRNRYLTAEQRAVAPRIYETLKNIADRLARSPGQFERLEAEFFSELATIPGAAVEYASIVTDDTLRPLSGSSRRALVACAVAFGPTRLIDNLTVVLAPEGL